MLKVTLNRNTGEIARELLEETSKIDYTPLVKMLVNKYIKEWNE